MNIGSWIVMLILLLTVGTIIFHMIRKKKKGKSGTCGCGCSACAMKDACHSQKS